MPVRPHRDTLSFRCPASLWGSIFCVGTALLCIGCDKPHRHAEAPRPAAVPTEFVRTPAFSGNNAYLHAAALCAFGPRPSGSAAYAQQLDYLERVLAAEGWQVQRDTFTAPNGTPMVNLRAVFGAGEGARPVLVSCHIDTKRLPGFIGADDGASAAGVMAELARVLAARAETAARVELIFLDGEEAFAARMTETDGLFGSRFDVARRQATGTLPRYQINLDMVGGADNVIAVPAYDTSDDMLACYAKALLTENLPQERWGVVPASYRDDHRPYLEAGVDSLNLIADFRGSTWWHKSGDTMERLSPRLPEQTGRLTLRLIQMLAH